MNLLKTVSLACTLALLVILSGCCGSYDPHAIDAWVKVQKTNLAPDGYILQPDDSIVVLASKVPEINLQRQAIRPDGKVFFESVGEIEAAGKTPKEVAEIIREKLLLLYALAGDNPVAIEVYRFDSRVYYVLGEVYFPGPRLCTGRDSLLRALADAKPTVLAWRDRVQVIRPSSDPSVKAKIFQLDWGKMAARGDTVNDVLLEEGDIIYVPPTVIASVAKKVAEFITPIGQAFAAVYYTVPTAPSTRYSTTSSSQ